MASENRVKNRGDRIGQNFWRRDAVGRERRRGGGGDPDLGRTDGRTNERTMERTAAMPPTVSGSEGGREGGGGRVCGKLMMIREAWREGEIKRLPKRGRRHVGIAVIVGKPVGEWGEGGIEAIRGTHLGPRERLLVSKVRRKFS
ncbi:hypothetical protein AXG93_48s1230 [Marchantia polymorpha subsp. ruderalis]|uniref:Uncharacterized protein n=1 Tax=Marchantia polymorpha subsp. ruderalis TaxID=1480154 RepID=A0A176VX94_MARPO|nr:hypothetical protein AXG93_48s1230 [Marchantia polymorpha subsp. ruderalis]